MSTSVKGKGGKGRQSLGVVSTNNSWIVYFMYFLERSNVCFLSVTEGSSTIGKPCTEEVSKAYARFESWCWQISSRGSSCQCAWKEMRFDGVVSECGIVNYLFLFIFSNRMGICVVINLLCN